MLALIPGVGDITIAALLDFFKTPSAVFRAEESELYKVTGLSPQKVKSIIEMGKKIEKKEHGLIFCGTHYIPKGNVGDAYM